GEFAWSGRGVGGDGGCEAAGRARAWSRERTSSKAVSHCSREVVASQRFQVVRVRILRGGGNIRKDIRRVKRPVALRLRGVDSGVRVARQGGLVPAGSERAGWRWAFGRATPPPGAARLRGWCGDVCTPLR